MYNMLKGRDEMYNFLILANTEAKSLCGDGGSLQTLVNIMYFALTIIQWVVPVLLILWGTIDLVKSVVAGKEDDIKKNQKTLVRRIISAVIVFLIPAMVSILLGLIGTEGWKACWNARKAEISLELA